MHDRTRRRLPSAAAIMTAALLGACDDASAPTAPTPPADHAGASELLAPVNLLPSRIAFASSRSGNMDIWTITADGTGLAQVTTNPAADYQPTWSPDGCRIAFTSSRHDVYDDNTEIYVIDLSNSTETRLTDDVAGDGYPTWAPNGTRLAFVSYRTGNGDIFSMKADGTDVVNLRNTPGYSEDEPEWSR